MENKGKFIWNIISTAITIVLLIVSWNIYEANNFNYFTKAEYNVGGSKFSRDSNVKCNNNNSYKIENEDFNDAMFFKTIDVLPDTTYRVKCKIKTENVVAKDQYADVGAHICIGDTFEKSDNVMGTTDWKEITFCFNSKNRKQIDVGFRLGGAEGQAKGKAWFSDFSIESGLTDTSKTWNFLCVLFDNVDVDLDGKNIKLQLTAIDRDDITTCMRRFESSMEELSQGKIRVNYDIVETATPITHFSEDEENGYFVSGYDVRSVIDPYIEQGKYDHIFMAFRTGDINKQGAIPVNDWIGLGSMQYRGVGYSNIRLPDNDKNYVYKYDTRINTFPEEVLIHEFLHTLERNAEEYGYVRPELHSSAKYGYENEALVGLRDWYKDYMNKEIKEGDKMVGLPSEIFTKKPPKTTDFAYSHKMKDLDEPENVIEELKYAFERIKYLFGADRNYQKEG